MFTPVVVYVRKMIAPVWKVKSILQNVIHLWKENVTMSFTPQKQFIRRQHAPSLTCRNPSITYFNY